MHAFSRYENIFISYYLGGITLLLDYDWWIGLSYIKFINIMQIAYTNKTIYAN